MLFLYLNDEKLKQKRDYFEAFLYELLKWWKEKDWKDFEGILKNNDIEWNDLSKLKVVNLLFLWLWALDDKEKQKKYLDIFNNFEAKTLWPFEVDIYNSMIFETRIWNCFKYFEVKNDKTSFKEDNKTPNFEEEKNGFAIDLVNALKKKNPNLINLMASELVDITHKWDCWKIARMFDNKKIPSNSIPINNWWYFS